MIWAILGFTIALFIGTHDARAHAFPVGQTPLPSADTVQGVKSKMVTQTVKLMAKALRKGEKPFFDACEKLASDPRALKAFRKHAGKIADVLDEIAKIPDLVLGVVGQQLFFLLTTDRGPIQMDPGSAKMIEKVVVAVINALI
jgi:hypothetical protein